MRQHEDAERAAVGPQPQRDQREAVAPDRRRCGSPPCRARATAGSSGRRAATSCSAPRVRASAASIEHRRGRSASAGPAARPGHLADDQRQEAARALVEAAGVLQHRPARARNAARRDASTRQRQQLRALDGLRCLSGTRREERALLAGRLVAGHQPQPEVAECASVGSQRAPRHLRPRRCGRLGRPPRVATPPCAAGRAGRARRGGLDLAAVDDLVEEDFGDGLRDEGLGQRGGQPLQALDALAGGALALARPQQLALVAPPVGGVEDRRAHDGGPSPASRRSTELTSTGSRSPSAPHDLDRDLAHRSPASAAAARSASRRRSGRRARAGPGSRRTPDEVLARVARPAQERLVDLDDRPVGRRRQVAAGRVLVEVLGALREQVVARPGTAPVRGSASIAAMVSSGALRFGQWPVASSSDERAARASARWTYSPTAGGAITSSAHCSTSVGDRDPRQVGAVVGEEGHAREVARRSPGRCGRSCWSAPRPARAGPALPMITGAIALDQPR